MKSFTCLSCRYSTRNPGGNLWCEFHRRIADFRCAQFRYEPGTDEEEAKP